MTVRECYEKMGANYDGVLSRLGNEMLIRKFVIKFLKDPSFQDLTAAIEKSDAESAFRAAHTLKGICLNLGFDNLYKPSEALTEKLRGGELNGYEKNSLYQYHIQDGSAADTQQSTFFPFVEQNNKNDCNCLRKPMCAARRDIFETVDNEKSDCGIWKYCSKILYKFRRIFPFGKNHKWDKTGCHRSKNNSSNSNDCLCCCHCHFAATSGLLLYLCSAVKHRMIRIMAGTINLLFPKSRRQTAEQINPVSAGR